MGQPVMQFQILSKSPDKSAGVLFETVRLDDQRRQRAAAIARSTTGSDNGINGGIWPSPPEGHAFVQLSST